jgi:hypothetical protein
VDVNYIHVVDFTIIEEAAAPPIAAGIAHADVAEAVIDPTVEPDVRAPVAVVPDIASTFPAPVTGSP